MKKKISLYINVPFCKSKCNYCDYRTVIYKQDYVDIYIQSLIKEMNLYQNKYSLETIYLGGGTPSLLDTKNLNKIFSAINKNFMVLQNCETTIEVNPENLNEKKLIHFKKNNINRISVGIQSFSKKILKFLGRNENTDFNTKINLIKKYFNNINVDLMFAVPRQSLNDIFFSLNKYIEYEIPHIAIYNLMIEPKTYLYYLYKQKKINNISDELYEEMYSEINKFLIKNNYNHYELSTYSKKGFYCKHNLNYWLRKNYIGIGAGAASFINEKRWNNVKYPQKYIELINSKKSIIENSEKLNKIQILNETIMLLLHQEKGIDTNYFKKKFKINLLVHFKEKIEKLIEEKLIFIENNTINLTLKGKLLSNQVTTELFL